MTTNEHAAIRNIRYRMSAILSEVAGLSQALDLLTAGQPEAVYQDEPADEHYSDSPWDVSMDVGTGGPVEPETTEKPEDDTPTEPAPEQVEDTPEPTELEPAKDEAPQLESVVSLEQVRVKLADLSRAGHTNQVRQIIQDQGVAKLSEIPEDKYGDVLEAAEKIAA